MGVLTPLTPEQASLVAKKSLREGYLYRVIKGLDEFGNVLTDGNLGQSLSSRIGLDAAKGDHGAIALAEFLNLFEANHCVLAERSDEAQAQLVVDAEKASPDLPEGK